MSAIVKADADDRRPLVPTSTGLRATGGRLTLPSDLRPPSAMGAVRRLATQHLGRMIIYAHTYNSDKAAKAEYERFHRWSARRRSQVSIWRGYANQDAEWWVVVVDDSDGDTLQHFPWRGRRLALPLPVTLGFIERRAEWLRAKHANGQGGPAHEKVSYGLAAAPRLRADGTWETPTPGRG